MSAKTSPVVQDDLLLCLAAVTAFYGRAKTPEALSSGLAYDGNFTPDVFCAAAKRVGIHAAIKPYTSPEKIAPQIFPCVLLLKDGAVVLHEINKAALCRIWNPVIGVEQTIPLREIVGRFGGRVILLKPAPSFIDPLLREVADKEAGGWLRRAFSDNKPLYIKMLLASLLINIFALVSPIYVMNVYDRVIPNNAVETGWALGIGALLAFGFDFIIRTIRGLFIDVAGRNMDVEVSRSLFDHILDMKLSARPSSSGAYASMLREFDTVREFFTSATMVTLVDLPFAALFLFIILMLGGGLVLPVIALFAISFLVAYLVQIPLKHYVRRALRSSETKHGLLVESIYGLETIKTVVADARIRARYAAHVTENADAGLTSRGYSALAGNLSLFIQQAAVVVIILSGMYMIRDGTLTMGALIACVMLTGRALGPVTQLANLASRYHQTMGSLKTLQTIMAQPLERPEGTDFLTRADLQGAVTFDRVTFTYPQGGRPALDNVSFSIAAHEKVAIVGRIGSGKSTIARLILKLYDPQSGDVRIDGTSIAQIDPAELRRRMAYIAQDVTLFQGTIRDNIAIGRPQASEADILDAAKRAGAHDFVALHPMGYDAPVQERGDGLSGGQRQAIALARALLMQPQVFICDEPTNAMDTQAENYFVQMMQNEIGQRGLILITHRLSLLNLVDRMIVLEGGRVVMDGPRGEVIDALSRGKGGGTV